MLRVVPWPLLLNQSDVAQERAGRRAVAAPQSRERHQPADDVVAVHALHEEREQVRNYDVDVAVRAAALVFIRIERRDYDDPRASSVAADDAALRVVPVGGGVPVDEDLRALVGRAGHVPGLDRHSLTDLQDARPAGADVLLVIGAALAA